MLPNQPKKNPAGGPGFSRTQTSMTRRQSTSPRLPRNWRVRLPEPTSYYADIGKLGRPNSAGWAQGLCPFHDDHDASLSVRLDDPRGFWRCFAGCGAGDLVSFHQRQTGFDFKRAVADLIGGLP